MMAIRMMIRADDLGSRATLFRYFARNAAGRWPFGSTHRSVDRPASGGAMLSFRLGGLDWEVRRHGSQLGGIHDVWIAHEYNAYPGFVAAPGSVVLDVGANVGAYSLWQWTSMAGHGTLVAVEASPSTVPVLRGNIERNSAGVSLVEAAVWREVGTVEFVVSDRTSSTAGVSDTVDTALIRDARTVAVSATTLELLMGEPPLAGRAIDIMKLDVEGAELEVLRGASAHTLARIKRIVVETDERTTADVRALLEAAGFRFLGTHRRVGYFVGSV